MHVGAGHVGAGRRQGSQWVQAMWVQASARAARAGQGGGLGSPLSTEGCESVQGAAAWASGLGRGGRRQTAPPHPTYTHTLPPPTHPHPHPHADLPLRSGERLLEERLRRLNLAMRVMDGDGNCQFRSVSFGLYGELYGGPPGGRQAAAGWPDLRSLVLGPVSTINANGQLVPPAPHPGTDRYHTTVRQRAVAYMAAHRPDVSEAAAARQRMAAGLPCPALPCPVCAPLAPFSLPASSSPSLSNYGRHAPPQFEAFLGSDFDAYLREMARPGVWGDELTLVCVAVCVCVCACGVRACVRAYVRACVPGWVGG